jgi:Protein of unknown function (DUF3467)
MPDSPSQQPLQLQMQLPPETEVGVYADFASVWHTPNTFVLDFLSVKVPAHPPIGPDGAPTSGDPVLDVKVAARVRIPSEQIFPLITALQEQGNQWLHETGRSEPPTNWVS